MVVSNIINNKCPHCKSGKVFQRSSLLTFQTTKMHHKCPECGFNFERESGFYWGAMYVSYGLAVIECFLTYFVCRLLGVPSFDFTILWAIMGVIVLSFPFNYRFSRLTWLYIFA
ncbi:DUF983 domain-containing protein [Emticicia sp. CRIBPO]|uniref:DUF983 domain-containing protein n=1 Tax=Emticicia sp. CRIBPO TaxID=2683258 RepID=UPI00141286C6|nr:DUF983 domain-containing protein [Emticicia sp. CRIBPO]NBA85239.1 DUF983 domain-containing protein [Emticicia sp. CRIBPO]